MAAIAHEVDARRGSRAPHAAEADLQTAQLGSGLGGRIAMGIRCMARGIMCHPPSAVQDARLARGAS